MTNCGENESMPTYIYRHVLILSIIKLFRNLEIHTVCEDCFALPLETISE